MIMADKGVLYVSQGYKVKVIARSSLSVRVTLQNTSDTDATIDRLALAVWYDLSTIGKSLIAYTETDDGYGLVLMSANPPTTDKIYIGMETREGILKQVSGARAPPIVLLDRVNMFVNKTIPAGQTVSEEAEITRLPLWLPYLDAINTRGRTTNITMGYVLQYLRGMITLDQLRERFGVKLVPNKDPVKLKFRATIISGGVPVLDTGAEASFVAKPGIPGLKVSIQPVVKAPKGVTTSKSP